MPTRPLRLWQWETAPNGLPQRERLTHPSDQHRSNSLRRAQILCEGDSSANFKVLALPNTLWGWRLLGAIFLLSLCLAKPGSHHLFFFLFLFFLIFSLISFLFLAGAIFALPLCLTSVSGSHLLQTYGALIFIPGDPVLGCNPGNTPWPPRSKGGLLSLLVLDLWP